MGVIEWVEGFESVDGLRHAADAFRKMADAAARAGRCTRCGECNEYQTGPFLCWKCRAGA